ncbi:MAG: amidase [Planctomycetota bacterium]
MLNADASLVDIAHDLRRDRRRVTRYVGELLDRAEAIEPVLRCLLPEASRRERLLSEAGELTRRYPSDSIRPALYGVPVGVTDMIFVEGLPTRCGSALPPEVFDAPESSLVTALRARGALVFGKTTVDEFAWAEPTATRNPVNVEHTPGGASAGAAAGVAAGLFPLAVGVQTNRSIIGPAAFTGVAGYKPTHGRVPTDGMVYCAPSLDVVGLFAQDAAGLLHAASLVVPDWTPSPPSDLPRLAVPDGAYLDPVSGEPRRVFDAQLESLRWAGYEIEYELFPSREDLAEHYRLAGDLLHGEMARVHGAWFRDWASLYRPGTVRAIEKGWDVKEEGLVRARDGREALRDEIQGLMDRAAIDFMICPSSNGPAPRGDRPTGYGAMTTLWSYAGMPCVGLPGATTEAGLPLGLQLVGRHGKDEALLECARFIHRKLLVR